MPLRLRILATAEQNVAEIDETPCHLRRICPADVLAHRQRPTRLRERGIEHAEALVRGAERGADRGLDFGLVCQRRARIGTRTVEHVGNADVASLPGGVGRAQHVLQERVDLRRLACLEIRPVALGCRHRGLARRGASLPDRHRNAGDDRDGHCRRHRDPGAMAVDESPELVRPRVRLGDDRQAPPEAPHVFHEGRHRGVAALGLACAAPCG